MGLLSLNTQRHVALKALIFMVMLVGVMKPPISRAETLSRLVTVYNSWEEEEGTSNSSAAQYLDLRTSGNMNGFKLDLEGSGRIAAIEEEIEAGDDDVHRLYSLSLTVSKPGSGGWLTLGRQAISALTGPNIIDGVSLSIGSDPFTVNARWGIISDISNDDPDKEETFGIGADCLLRSGMTIGLDYAQITDDGHVMEELVAVDWTYSWFRHTKAYFTLNYDLMSETYHEVLLGTRIFLSELIATTIEYSQNVSRFEADSIYSVFAIDATETTAFSLMFTPNPDTRYIWEYAVESFEGGDGGKRYVLGGRWTPGRSSFYLDFIQHLETGGELIELSLGASAYIHPLVKLGIGGDFSSTEPENDESISSYLGYLGGEWKPSPNKEMTLRVEQSGDEVLEDPTLAIRLALKLEF